MFCAGGLVIIIISNRSSSLLNKKRNSQPVESETGRTDSEAAPAGKRMGPSDCADYDTLVSQLADRLKIARHPDSSITIKAARLLIENHCSSKERNQQHQMDKELADQQQQAQQLRESSTKPEREIRIQKSRFSLDDISLPAMMMKSDKKQQRGEGGDAMEKDELREIFERAAKALKLLYLDDQKQLQLQVNGIILTIQAVTANPKTDANLMATGR